METYYIAVYFLQAQVKSGMLPFIPEWLEKLMSAEDISSAYKEVNK